MVIPMKDYTHFGYDYLDKVGLTQIHSGVDLNRGRPNDDLGDPIHAMANGTVVYSKNTGKGWGNLIVIYHAAYGCWSRYAHLNTRKVSVGDKVAEGELIGECGATGGNWAAHLHWDVIIKELSTWTKYTTWWSREKVQEYYADPIKYVNETNYGESKEDPIVKWHKDNNIIEKWDNNPTQEDIKIGWAIYKALKVYKNNPDIKFNL